METNAVHNSDTKKRECDYRYNYRPLHIFGKIVYANEVAFTYSTLAHDRFFMYMRKHPMIFTEIVRKLSYLYLVCI